MAFSMIIIYQQFKSKLNVDKDDLVFGVTTGINHNFQTSI